MKHKTTKETAPSIFIRRDRNGISVLTVFNGFNPVFHAMARDGKFIAAWATIWAGDAQFNVQSNQHEVAQFVPFSRKPA